MGRGERKLRKELADLVGPRPGWRLEARSTPGAPPLWCYVDGGRVELSVTADEGRIRLYVMATDDEVVLEDSTALMAWLQREKADALREPHARPTPRDRSRSFFEWG